MSGILHRDMNIDLVGGRALFIPTSARLHQKPVIGACSVVVTAEGDVCGTPFFDLREKISHVTECAKKHASAINAYRLRTHPDIMRAWDPELEAWITKHREAILDGRKRVS